MKKLLVLVTALALTAASVTACQDTVKGFGQDMERNGQKLQK